MSVIEDMEIGPAALGYIRECLSCSTLPLLVAKRGLESGHVHAYLPSDSAPRARYQFTEGGILPPATPIVLASGTRMSPVRMDPGGLATEQPLLDFIQSYLLRTSRGCVIFQDIMSVPTDVNEPGVPYFLYGAEVYRFTSHDSQDAGVLERMIDGVQSANARLFVGLLTALGEGANLRPAQQVTREMLEKLARNVAHVIIGAYDGEGELIWSNKEATP